MTRVDTRPEVGASSTRGLRAGELNLFDATVVVVSSVAPAYSLAATLSLLFVAVAYAGPAVIVVSFIPVLFIAVAYFYLNRREPQLRRLLRVVVQARQPFGRLVQRLGATGGQRAVLRSGAPLGWQLHPPVPSFARLGEFGSRQQHLAHRHNQRAMAGRHHIDHYLWDPLDGQRPVGVPAPPVRRPSRHVHLGDPKSGHPAPQRFHHIPLVLARPLFYSRLQRPCRRRRTRPVFLLGLGHGCQRD